MGQDYPVHDPHRLAAALERLRDEECLGCPEVSVRSAGQTHESMPRPKYVDQAVQMLAPEALEEPHQLDPESHCINPKCNYRMDQDTMEEADQTGKFTCPQCGTVNDLMTDRFTPGGSTRSGLTLDAMGNIGEEIVFRMGELPGVGTIEQTFPSIYEQKGSRDGTVDMIVRASDGTRYGCEIKSNHSLAQERFKVGDRADRLSKIKYCAANGLKPAIVGVRLNFFTDKASIFFREGMTDTWIGNQKMRHVATVNFSDLNPFQYPDPTVKQQAIENAHLPDQAVDTDADIDAAFGPDPFAVSAAIKEPEAPELSDGRFTFKDHQHEVKVYDKKGKHKTTIKRCLGCGVLYERPAEHRGMFQCPTCGEDPDQRIMLTKVIIASPMDQPVDLTAWNPDGVTSNGHRRYIWVDASGYKHIVVGNSQRTKVEMDQAHTQQRMRQCMLGKCFHARNQQPTMPTEDVAQNGVWRPGDQVNLNGQQGLIVEVAGTLAVVQNLATGQEDVVPVATLERQAGIKEPDFLFVFYMGKLKVEPYHHNTKHDDMLESLLKENGYDGVPHDLDPTKVAAGEVFEFSDGSIKVEHRSMTELSVREEVDPLIALWFEDKEDVLPAKDETKSDQDDRDGDAEEKVMDFDAPDHWRRLPRDEEGQWVAL